MFEGWGHVNRHEKERNQLKLVKIYLYTSSPGQSK